MLNEIIDHLVGEKMDYKEYEEMCNETDNEETKRMFQMLADDEKKHYHILKGYLENMIGE